MTRIVLLAFVLIAAPVARGEGLEFTQRLDARLPLDLPLRDEAGRSVRLGDYFAALPVVLVLGYFDCPNLCSTVLDGIMESLARTDLSAYRLVAVSIDPREESAAARRKKMAYRDLAGGKDLHFLVGDSQATARLAAGVGFPYAWDEKHGQYMHPAGFVVATPDGRIARYFLGVRFEPRALRLALLEAANGRTGSLSDRLLLLCSHYDPKSGRYSIAVMAVVRTLCIVLAMALGIWIWRRRAGRG